MIIQKRIEEKINSALDPISLIVLNESDQHSGPPGRESHFRIQVVSEMFEGLSLVDRHRKINEILKEELAQAIHALAIETLTENEWMQRNQKIQASPQCLGGPKKK